MAEERRGEERYSVSLRRKLGRQSRSGKNAEAPVAVACLLAYLLALGDIEKRV